MRRCLAEIVLFIVNSGFDNLLFRKRLGCPGPIRHNVSPMSTIEIIIRSVAVTSAVILAASLARARSAPVASRMFGALFCLGVASYVPCSVTASICTTAPGVPLMLLATAIPFFFWGWTRSVMDDDFHLTPMPVAAGIALLATPAVSNALAGSRCSGVGIALHSVVGIGFVAMALFDALRGRRQDLIEARRRLRLVVFGIAGAYSVIVLAVEMILQNRPATGALQMLNAAMLGIVLLGLAVGLLAISDPLKIAFGWSDATPPSNPSVVEPAPVATRDLEAEIVERLQDKMSRQALYRDASLSVSTLAESVGVAEKRLRQIINQRLGHRNFSSFVNAYRLEEARIRLEDSRNDSLPILTIALDAGFGSIVVFNRVFKEKLGVTPSQYRERRSDKSGKLSND